MDDQKRMDGVDTFVPYDHLTSKTRLLKSISELERDNEDPESSEATSGIKTFPFVETRISWAQRVLGWFRGN